MIGFPSVLNTKEDWQHAVDYVKEHGTNRKELVLELENLRDNMYMNVLKESSKEKDPEELTPDDFEKVEDPNCDKKRLGISDEEIAAWIEEVEE